MKSEFVPYELAVKLKKLGFDEPCFVLYKASNNNQLAYAPHGIITNSQLSQGDSNNIAAPLFQQAFRWFREEHNLGHMINGIGYESFLFNIGGLVTVFPMFKTYEEAELACLDKMIEIVESKQQKTNTSEWNGPYAH
jgi:hypothetical protein